MSEGDLDGDDDETITVFYNEFVDDRHNLEEGRGACGNAGF